MICIGYNLGQSKIEFPNNSVRVLLSNRREKSREEVIVNIKSLGEVVDEYNISIWDVASCSKINLFDKIILDFEIYAQRKGTIR